MLKIEELKNEFKLLLKDDLKKAIQTIESSLNHNSKFYDDVILLYSQIARLNKSNYTQVISYQNYTLEYNKIQKGILEIINELKIDDLKNEPSTNKDNEKEETGEQENHFEFINYGIFKNKIGQYKINIEPTVFFSRRLSNAFPGVRELKWFEGNKAIQRLSILLKEPTKFDIADGYGIYADPIWWFRGSIGAPIRKFKILSHGKCLIDSLEFKVARVAAYHSSSYYRCFVYVETEAEIPIGLYKYPEGYIDEVEKEIGYYKEEYAVFNGIPIRREEYDDGAAEINGDVVNTLGAELRLRYLTNFNFIIVAKTSPFNSMEANKLGDKFMNDILRGERNLEEFLNKAELLKRNWMDK